jgi:hypothetical protein
MPATPNGYLVSGDDPRKDLSQPTPGCFGTAAIKPPMSLYTVRRHCQAVGCPVGINPQLSATSPKKFRSPLEVTEQWVPEFGATYRRVVWTIAAHPGLQL